jgi:ribonuclease BN (tRNA processing enzyme)
MKLKENTLLFDTGAGTMRRLLEAGFEIFDVSFIFYSHFHPDHTGELVSFLFSNKYPDGTRRQIPITFVAGKGFLSFYEKLKLAYGSWIELDPDLLNILELENNAYDTRVFDDFTVESLPVAHNDESIAYKITSTGGKSIVYSGDTDFSENLVNLKVKGHLTPSLAGEISKQANVGKLVLTHFYPECDHVDIENECRKTYDGPLILAEDLMKIEL